MANHDLVAFMKAITDGVQSEYTRIQNRVKEDPGTAGDQGEENWATLLREWLPPAFQVVTKGRIISRHGKASGQIDVLVLRPCYPRFLLDKKLYLSAGVAAAFECKLTLRRAHILKAFRTACEIRRLLDNRPGHPVHELYSTLVYGVLAHSHEWNRKDSDPLKSIRRAIVEGHTYSRHPRECLDFICASDLATWSVHKMPFTFLVGYSQNSQSDQTEQIPCTAYNLSHRGMFASGSESFRATTPIGSFLAQLLPVLAVHHSELKEFAWHFRQTGTWRGSKLVDYRGWNMDVFSAKAKELYDAQRLSDPDVAMELFP